MLEESAGGILGMAPARAADRSAPSAKAETMALTFKK